MNDEGAAGMNDEDAAGMNDDHELLVVGSGIAGCAAALGAAREGSEVLLVTKAERPEDAATDWAQGGIATSRGDPESLKKDIVDASDGTADEEAVGVLVSEADSAVRDVLVETLDVPFDGDHADSGDDSFDYAREAAHSEERILHVDASTGEHVLRPFLNYLDGHEQVHILDDTAALDLITHEGRVYGAVLDRTPDGEPAPAGERVYADTTILATGGIGSCYGRSTNPEGATGDGIAMAALAGADVADMEFVQFHPTAYAPPEDEVADSDGDSFLDSDGDSFLVSEAVRGAGATLENGEGERFMPEYHEDAELAPRDVVARAVARERERTGKVVLDVSGFDFRAEFPDLAVLCDDAGVDLPEIPVAPTQHFLCGGIDVDLSGRASLDRLYAVGECARTGVHGANRLGSTSLLEGLVWGLRAGADAASVADTDSGTVEAPELLDRDPALPDRFAAEKFVRLQRIMDEHVGLRRSPDGLRRAGAVLRRLKGEVDAYVRTRTSRSLYELRNAAVTALLVTRAAADNPNSLGCHYVVEDGDELAETEATAD